MPASTGNIRSVIEIVAASADPGARTVSHLDCAGHSAALPSDRSAAIAEVPNPALAKEQMRAAIVRRSRKKASTQYHRPNAVGKAPRAIVDHFAPKGASEVSLGKADGRWPGARIRAAGQIAPPSWPGERLGRAVWNQNESRIREMPANDGLFCLSPQYTSRSSIVSTSFTS